MSARLVLAVSLVGFAACAPTLDASHGSKSTEIVVAAPRSAQDAGDPRDAICTSLQAESAAARAAAEEEVRTVTADPARIAGERAEAEKRLAHAESELARWTKIAAREKVTPSPDPIWRQMASTEIDASKRQIEEATAELSGPAKRAPLPDDLPKPNLPPYLNKCSKVEDGVWATVLRELHFVEVRDSAVVNAVSGRWVVVHVGLDGKRSEIMPLAAMGYPGKLPDGGAATITENIPTSVAEDMIAPDPVAFDFDGDGHSEYVVSIGFTILSMNNDEVDVWGNVLTVKDGAVQIYKPAKDLSITDVRDENGDGRPDLVSSSQHHEDAEEGCMNECGGEWVADPPTLWLSRPDGTFVQAPFPRKTGDGAADLTR